MNYQPTLKDFEHLDSYQPSENDFQLQNQPIGGLSKFNLSQDDSLEDALKQGLIGSSLNFLTQSAKQPAQQLFPEQLALGASESVPRTLISSLSGIGELFGKKAIKLPHEEMSDSLVRSLGRGIGELGTYGALSVPFALGTEAATSSLLPNYLGQALGSGVAGSILEPGNLNERLKKGAEFGGTSLALSSINPLKELGKSLITKYKPKDAGKLLQQSYENKLNKISGEFDSIESDAEKLGINKIPIDKKLFKEIKNEVPKSKKFDQFIEKSENGNYKDLRRLQTELRKRATKAKSSDSLAEQDHGDRLNEFRDEINDSIANYFTKSDHDNLAIRLRQAMGSYRNLFETYHTHPTISKLVGENKLIPKNLLSTLEEDSVRMRRLLNEHPELQKHLSIEQNKQKIKSIGKTLGIGSLATKILLGGSGIKGFSNDQ